MMAFVKGNAVVIVNATTYRNATLAKGWKKCIILAVN